MKGALVVLALSCLAGGSRVQAQEAGNGLEVRPDKQNVVAGSLLGDWQLDGDLNRRLGHRGGVALLTFREDATVVGKIPAAIAEKLSERRIYQAGTMVRGDEEHVYLLTEWAGNPAIVWFRPRGGDPCGDAELWNVSLVRAEARQADLLFVGGDFNNQSFAAYARVTEVVGKLEPGAALEEIIRLLEAGKAEEFVDTYVAPRDLATMIEAGRTKERLVARFEGERVKELIEKLRAASRQRPTLDATGDLATWPLDGDAGAVRLQRIDGRWYVRER